MGEGVRKLLARGRKGVRLKSSHKSELVAMRQSWINSNMGLYLRVTDKAIVDAVTLSQGDKPLTDPRTLLDRCAQAHSVHYANGMPVGLLFPVHLRNVASLLEYGAGTPQDWVLSARNIPRFGQEYDLYVPNSETAGGREYAAHLEALAADVKLARYTLDLVGPRIKSKLMIDELGYDYLSQARVHIVRDLIYVALTGVSMLTQSYERPGGVEFITRTEYRAAIKQSALIRQNLLFSDDDSLVVRAQAALAPFIQVEASTVSILLTDIWDRVIVEPQDLKHYIRQLLLDRELTYVFTTLVGILHAFYGVE